MVWVLDDTEEFSTSILPTGQVRFQGCAPLTRPPTILALSAPPPLLWEGVPPRGSPQWHSTTHIHNVYNTSRKYKKGTYLMYFIFLVPLGHFPWISTALILSSCSPTCPLELLLALSGRSSSSDIILPHCTFNNNVRSIGYSYRKIILNLLPYTNNKGFERKLRWTS